MSAMWTRQQFLLALGAMLLPTTIGPLGGCAGPNANRKGASKEESHLVRSAGIYWHSVRWADAEKASIFIEDPAQRLLFKEWLERQSDKRRYEEATVIQAVMADGVAQGQGGVRPGLDGAVGGEGHRAEQGRLRRRACGGVDVADEVPGDDHIRTRRLPMLVPVRPSVSRR